MRVCVRGCVCVRKCVRGVCCSKICIEVIICTCGTNAQTMQTPRSYADDTIIVGTDSRRLNADLAELETAAELYGLRLNKKKCVLLAMYHAPDVRFKDGTKVKKVEEALYLGLQLSDSMDMTKEINMRIRSTMSTWKALGESWKHGNVSLRKKVSSVWGCHQIKAVIWLW